VFSLAIVSNLNTNRARRIKCTRQGGGGGREGTERSMFSRFQVLIYNILPMHLIYLSNPASNFIPPPNTTDY